MDRDPVDWSGRFGLIVDPWALAVWDETYRHGVTDWLLHRRSNVDLLRSLALDLRGLGLDDEHAVRVSHWVMSRWGSGLDSDVDEATSRHARECIAKHTRPAMPSEVSAAQAMAAGTRAAPAPAALRPVLPSVCG
ncbi:MAG: hypothetical protein ACRDY1_05880, partial [Acidimicrobiales bacterium]